MVQVDSKYVHEQEDPQGVFSPTALGKIYFFAGVFVVASVDSAISVPVREYHQYPNNDGRSHFMLQGLLALGFALFLVSSSYIPRIERDRNMFHYTSGSAASSESVTVPIPFLSLPFTTTLTPELL